MSAGTRDVGQTVPVGARTSRRDRFLNRELSWLDFDRRVLELAADPDLPLLERVKLCAIVSSNLDGFFAVRMGGLLSQVASEVKRRSPDGRTPTRTLTDVRERVIALQLNQDALWLDHLRPALAAESIRVAKPSECAPRELRSLAKRFDREVRPLLTPIALGAAAPFPHVPSFSLSIGAIVAGAAGERRFLRVNVPDDLPRFLDVGHGVQIPLEDAILHFLGTVVGRGELEGQMVFRITRAAGLSVSHGADDLLEAVERQLRRRPYAEVVRLEIDSCATPELVELLQRELRIDASRIYRSAAPIGLSGLLELANAPRPDLKETPWRPVPRAPFHNRAPAALLTQIRRRDILVQHPYDPFDTTVEAFVSAAREAKVSAVKATVYRTGDPSKMLGSLVDAAGEGKQAVCLVELTARFDERRNIEWSRALERAGVDVAHGAPDLKVHAKLALLVRRERGGLRRYVHIGTGNYHATNATTYEDLSLFTADQEIAEDVAEVFNAVTGSVQPSVFRKLLVGPWFLREGLLHEIGRVIHCARAGEPARIRIKVNALVDPEIIDALYAASAAGVSVEVVTRGICSLTPGVPDLSENITVRSVLGRFLEHSRILSFQAGDRTSTWIGSADLMPRNLDRRVEVLVPVEDARARAELNKLLDALQADTRFSWELGPDGTWSRTAPAPGELPVSAQELLMARAAKRAKKR
jgi:polyphosphate kinase